MMYICAWQALGLPPVAEISSRMTDASVSEAPPPPYSSGTRAPEEAGLGEGGDELLGVGVGLEGAPVGAVEALAHLAHAGAQVVVLGSLGQVHPQFVSFINSKR